MKTQPITALTDGIHKAEDLEKSILGICMMEPEAFHKIATILKPEMFYIEFNQDTFTAMQQLFDQGLRPDLVTVTIEMMKFKVLYFYYLKLKTVLFLSLLKLN